MAPIASELATLRALTFRISSTPTPQLPHHVPAIAASLANCRTLLASPQTSVSKSSSESAVAIHKFRTLLSTLLQDRTIQGRWSAIILIKATIEVGGWETLQKCLPWVRGLLGILNKPDPPSSKKLCIIALTRIFILTREYPTLVREITTPSLPAFIQSGLHMANSKAPSTLLQVILESFNELLPRHPTIFRSYLKQLNPFLARLIAPTPSSKLGVEQAPGSKPDITAEVVDAAQQLYVLTPCCTPKGATSEEWEKSFKATINSAHRVADKVFRAVFEDWRPSTRETTNGHTLDDEVQDLEPDDMGLSIWSGIFAGGERLLHLLRLIQHYLANTTANPVTLNIAVIVDLVTRLLSLTIPGIGGKALQNSVKANNQVSKEERENLWLLLPGVHVAAIEVLLVLAQRSRSSTLPLDSLILDQIVWVFAAEKNNLQIRAACYHAVATVLQRSGAATPKSSIDSLVPLMRACCEELLPSDLPAAPTTETPGQAKANGKTPSQVTANADSFLNSSKSPSTVSLPFAGLQEAAHSLLPILLSSIRALYLSDALRSRLDRTAILTQHKDAMVASVLNPPPSKRFGKPAASILPLIARSFSASPDVEGMIRPRLPVIRLGRQDIDESGEDEEEEVSEVDEEEIEDVAMVDQEQDHFVGHELDTILESAGRTGTDAEDATMSNAADANLHDSVAATDIPTTTTEVEPLGEQSSSKELGKRPHIEHEPSSPSKRVRFAEEADLTQPEVSSVPLTGDAPSGFAPSLEIPVQTSDFTVTTTASAIPQLPGPDQVEVAGSDSDEDDVISLVLGQDTDDESE
ncbi:rRNA processing/ribosome biogenesis-domain-containing protein [Paraphoma chrysanthemicola]|uniref:Pre-rRNA-processing protein RIX1 n=1 Tax=Paraphoma chrysanthemicola TaxID=798071 RepID=A0A8K0VYF3_9PLEO|nr:rRNA processing/ribosome biogenesis-domain-containing protein [Paraphoma chrysanthemicola]